MTTVDNLNGLELLSGRLVTLFLTLAEAEEAVKSLPAGTHVKVTNDPNPDLNGEYTWDGEKLLKTTNNTLEKAKEQAEEVAQEIIDRNVTASHVLDLLEGQITGSLLDRRLEQRIEKIPSIVGEIEELKNEVTTINYDLGVKVNYINFDLEKLTKYVEELELIVDVDFSEIKQQIQDLHDQVNSDFEAVRVKIDELQAQVTADFEKVRQEVKDLQAQVDADIKKLQKEVADKFLEVDQIKIGLDKEIQDRIEAVKAETEARVEGIRLLNDGLTKEIQERKDGDQKLLTNIENYKTSNNKALANVREQVTVAVNIANASAQKVEALDARVVSAENNSKTALENSASAVTKVNALASDVGSMSEKVDTLEANVIKAVDDSGKALTNSATAISQSKTAVDKANAVSEQVNVVEAKLNDKSTTYRTNTAPTKATHPNLTVGDVWINQDKKNEQKRWDGKAWVDINDVRISDNATAISKTNATVTEQGKTIQANVQKIGSLTASLGDKADASALTKLESTVTKQGTDIQANAKNITSLQGQIKDKADAKALNELSTKVTEQGGTIASQGQSITALNNQIKDKADASAVTQLTSTVTKQGETINAQGKQITTLEGKVDGKADATAVTELKATVTEHEGKIATQGQAITSLNNQIKDKADTKAVTALETKVTKQGEDITAQGKQITSVEAQLKDKASTQAVSTLDAKVNKQGETITAQGQALTGLKQEVDGKASVQAVDELKTTVTQQGKDITAHGQSLTSLQNQMKDKADAKALTALETKVTKQGDDIKSQGEAITSVEAHLDGMIIGGSNLIRKTDIQAGYLKSYSPNVVTFPALPKARTLVARSLTGSGASVGVNTVSDISLKAGQEYTLSFRGASSKGAFTYAYVVLNKSGASNIPLLLNNKPVSKVESVLTYISATFKCTHDVDTAHIMFACNGAVASDWVLVAEPMLVEGNTGTTWSKSIDELAGSEALNELKATVGKQGDTINAQGQSITGLKQEVDGKASSQAVNELKSTVTQQGKDIATQGQAITTLNNQIKDKADAKALTALETKVTENSGKIESQGTALTGVKASLGAMDSDSLTPDFLMANPESWYSHYSYPMAQYFKTTATGKIAPTVFRKDGSNPSSCWNYNMQNLPNDRAYKVSFWIRRSADSTGANYVTIARAKSDGIFAQVNHTHAGAFNITNNEEWVKYEKVVDNRSQAETYPQIRIGFAICHGGDKGWGEVQGFKVQPVLETGDVGSSIATAESVSKLSATVTQQGSTITSQGTAITGLENSIKDKADAKAVNELKTTVTQQGNELKSQGLSITKVEAKLSNVVVGNENLISKTKWLEPPMNAVNKADGYSFRLTKKEAPFTGNWARYGMWSELQIGTEVVFSYKIKVMDATKTNIGGHFGGFSVSEVLLDGVVIEGTSYSEGTAIVLPNDSKFHHLVVKAKKTGGDTGIYIQPNRATSYTTPYDVMVKEVMFSEGNTTSSWTSPEDFLGDQIDANAKAITATDAEVKRVDGVVTAQGSQITQLNADLGKKADGTALTALETKVTQQGKDITSQGQSITNLNNQIKNKADASAVNQLKTTVEQQGNTISSQGQSITSIKANVSDLTNTVELTDSDNLVKPFKDATGGGANYLQVSVPLKESITLKTGDVLTVKGRATFEHNGTLTSAQGLTPYLEGSPAFVSARMQQGKDQVFEGSLTVDSSVNGRVVKVLNFYFIPSGVANASTKTTIHWATLHRGGSLLEGKADASAVTALTADVKKIDDRVTSNTQAVTSLNSSLDAVKEDVNTKADAKALSDLSTTVTKQGNEITSQGKAITSVQSSVDDVEKLSQLIPNSKMLYNDPQFASGLNGLVPYDNASTGRVKLDRVPRYTVDNPTTSTHQVNVTVSAGASPNYGGFFQKIDARANAVFVIKYLLKLPVGYSLDKAGDAIGNGGTDKFIGSTAGTGKYETYVRVISCGAGGSFSNTGHVHVRGTALTGTQTMTFPVAQIETYDVTDYQEATQGVLDALSASSTAIGKLETRTTAVEGKTNTQATQITGLQSQVNGKADSSALNSLKTTVEQQGNTISSQGQSITQVESKVSGGAGGRNFIKDSDRELKTTGASSLFGFSGSVSPIYFDNKPLMVSVYVKVVNVKTRASSGFIRAGYETAWTLTSGIRYVGAWLGQENLAIGSSFEGRVYAPYTPAKSNPANTGNFVGGGLYIQGFTADQIIVSQPMITTGTITTEWSKAPEDQPEIDTSQFATATALNSLKTDVTKIDGKVDAQATAVQQLDTKVGQNSASIQTQSQTINGIQANWTMKMDVNGYVSGIGAMNDGKTSEFIVRADKFAVANPTGTGKKYGFVYQSSPKTLPNGTVIPAGLYVDNLILGDIDARKINAESISAISANLGRFESNVAGKGKTVISGTEYQVFDANGVERIFLGVR